MMVAPSMWVLKALGETEVVGKSVNLQCTRRSGQEESGELQQEASMAGVAKVLGSLRSRERERQSASRNQEH